MGMRMTSTCIILVGVTAMVAGSLGFIVAAVLSPGRRP
jgi:hypothetical protein